MADINCQVAVLGSGPGGYTAAFRAADLGLSVALIERYSTLGGVCLNVGCIPSKALLHTAAAIDEAAACRERGVEFGAPRIDLDKLRDWKQRVVGRLTSGLGKMAAQRGVQIVAGSGRFSSPRTIDVSGESSARVTFQHAIIAAGSRTVPLPGLPDDARIFDSTRALELPTVPRRLLVIGGGVIGLELATVYRALGARVTITEALDGLLLPIVDRDLVRPLERRLHKQCEAVWISTRASKIQASAEALRVNFEGKAGNVSADFDAILVAVGRRSNGDQIGAENAGVHVDERGVIQTDRQQRTNVPHIFAIGDITGPPLLAHRASHQAKVAAEVAAGRKSFFEPRAIPSVAYTNPEIAWVGVTEAEATAHRIPCEKAVFPWTASGRAIGMDDTDGLTKLLFDPGNRRLIGAGITGVHAGDLISELALAIEMGSDAADIALTIHPHPTLAETIGFSAEIFEGTVTDLYLGKKSRR